jgi:Fic family protein
MLKAFYFQAKETKELLFKIMNYYFEFKKRVKTEHKVIYTADLVEKLFSFPVITPVKLSSELDIHRTTATRYLDALSKGGLLDEGRVSRYHLYANKGLLKIIHR